MTPAEYERVHQSIMMAAFGGGAELPRWDLRVKVGFFSKNSFRSYLRGLRAAGVKIEWREPTTFLDQVWLIRGNDKAIEAMRQYCVK